MDDAPRRRRALRIDITPRTIMGVLLAIAAVWLLINLWHIVVLIIVSLVLMGTLQPMVRWLETHGMKRTWAVLLVFTGMLVMTSLLLVLCVPPLVEQVLHLVGEAPRRRLELIAWLQKSRITAPIAGVVRDAGMDTLWTSAGDAILGYSSWIVKAIGYGVTTVFLAFYLLADDKRAQGALFAVTPRVYHLRLARIMLNLETIVGGYVRGQLITSGAIAVFTFTLLTVFQVPNALPLAVFAGLTDVIPFVGGIIAMTPAVLAAIPQGGAAMVAILIAMIVYQEVESRILVPRIYGRVLRLSAATVVVALLIGGSLLGILGALLALPIAAALQMIIKELRVELPGDSTDATALRARDEVTEQAYQELSAGAAPQEAALIATKMAHAIQDADGKDPVDAAEVLITGGIEKESEKTA